jgi:hypothetical protein
LFTTTILGVMEDCSITSHIIMVFTLAAVTTRPSN